MGEQTIGPFEIARYPVTNVQFQAFLDIPNGYNNRAWWENLEPQEPSKPRWSETNVPRETVSWYEAVAFCRWLSARLGYTVRLPTEFEWQQAATGGDPDGEYPWGEWEVGRCNTVESEANSTTTVGGYPRGTWPGGPQDMAGNVWDWCQNKYEDSTDDVIDRSGDWRARRGGSWRNRRYNACCAYRIGDHPVGRLDNVGFRVLRPPSDED